MLTVTSTPLELRGISNKRSKNDKVYYVINVESADGAPHALYCPNAEALPVGMKKGDMVMVTFEVSYYRGNERLVVTRVEVV